MSNIMDDLFDPDYTPAPRGFDESDVPGIHCMLAPLTASITIPWDDALVAALAGPKGEARNAAQAAVIARIRCAHPELTDTCAWWEMAPHVHLLQFSDANASLTHLVLVDIHYGLDGIEVA